MYCAMVNVKRKNNAKSEERGIDEGKKRKVARGI
jgi:hypothetical protein